MEVDEGPAMYMETSPKHFGRNASLHSSQEFKASGIFSLSVVEEKIAKERIAKEKTTKKAAKERIAKEKTAKKAAKEKTARRRPRRRPQRILTRLR
jgi:topoisomerase IA-like protein